MANWCVPVVKRYPGVLSQLAEAGYWNGLPLWVLKSTAFLAGAGTLGWGLVQISPVRLLIISLFGYIFLLGI